MYIKPKTYNTNPVTEGYAVSDYLEALHKQYTEVYRPEWEKLDRKYKAEEKRWEDEIRRGWNDITRKMNDTNAHQQKLRDIKKEFAELAEIAKTEFNNIIAEADTRFERHARATGDKIDLATVELLKSGVLSSKEIKALADDFKGNIAMLRVIGKYAGEQAETERHEGSKQELKTVALACKDAQFNYREPLENYIGLAVAALSGDEKSSFGTSPFACNKVLNETYPEEYENAKSLYVSTECDGGDNNA